MSEHVTPWLNAYYDGELRGAHLRQVEDHLAECAGCQAELEGLRSLSTLLQETAPEGAFLSSERFAANLTLSLPRQPKAARPRSKALEVGWWLIPFGALGAWLVLRVTYSISTAVSLAENVGLFGSHLAWLQSAPLQMWWFSTVMNRFGDQVGPLGWASLSALNNLHSLITQAAGRLFSQALFMMLYLGWLAAWWLRRSSRSAVEAGNFSEC